MKLIFLILFSLFSSLYAQSSYCRATLEEAQPLVEQQRQRCFNETGGLGIFNGSIQYQYTGSYVGQYCFEGTCSSCAVMLNYYREKARQECCIIELEPRTAFNYTCADVGQSGPGLSFSDFVGAFPSGLDLCTSNPGSACGVNDGNSSGSGGTSSSSGSDEGASSSSVVEEESDCDEADDPEQCLCENFGHGCSSGMMSSGSSSGSSSDSGGSSSSVGLSSSSDDDCYCDFDRVLANCNDFINHSYGRGENGTVYCGGCSFSNLSECSCSDCRLEPLECWDPSSPGFKQMRVVYTYSNPRTSGVGIYDIGCRPNPDDAGCPHAIPCSSDMVSSSSNFNNSSSSNNSSGSNGSSGSTNSSSSAVHYSSSFDSALDCFSYYALAYSESLNRSAECLGNGGTPYYGVVPSASSYCVTGYCMDMGGGGSASSGNSSGSGGGGDPPGGDGGGGSGSSGNSSGSGGNYCDNYPDDELCKIAGYDEYCENNPNDPYCVWSRHCSSNPHLPECQNPQTPNGGGGIGMGGVSSGSSGSDTSSRGLGCKDLKNCDWSTLEVQLLQLGIDRLVLDSLSSLIEWLKRKDREDSLLTALRWLREDEQRSRMIEVSETINGRIFTYFAEQANRIDNIRAKDSLFQYYIINSAMGYWGETNYNARVTRETLQDILSLVSSPGFGKGDVDGNDVESIKNIINSLYSMQSSAMGYWGETNYNTRTTKDFLTGSLPGMLDGIGEGINNTNNLLSRLDSSLTAGNGDILGMLEDLGGSCTGDECGNYDGVGDGVYGGLDTSGISGGRWDELLTYSGSSGLRDSATAFAGKIRSVTATPFTAGMACPVNELSIDACGAFGSECKVSLCDSMFHVGGRHLFEWVGLMFEFVAWVLFLTRIV